MKNLVNFEMNKLIKNKFFHLTSLLLILIVYVVIYFLNKNNTFTFNSVITIQMFLSFITVFFASKILVGEFDNGTIKNIITKDYSRTKILFSKLIVLTLLIVYYLLLIYIFTILIIKGFNISINFLSYLKNYIINSISLIFITLFTYFISILILNSSISYIISMLFVIFGPSVSMFLIKLKIKFISYTFLPYLDLNVLLEEKNLTYIRKTYDVSLSIFKGTMILIITLLFLLLISFYKFKKMDIKK